MPGWWLSWLVISLSLTGWVKSQTVSFLKVDAHPEKRNKPADWSTEERGNFLADQVAGGNVEPMYTISASKWLNMIASRSKIVVKLTDGSPLIINHRRYKSKLDSKKYLHERDKYRIRDGKTPQWENANISLHHRLMGRSNRIGERVITQRIGLIKRWQWHSARSDNLCAGCNQTIVGISHPLRSCKHVDMITARTKSWNTVESTIMRCDRSFHKPLFSIARCLRESDGGDVACCGSFLPKFIDQIPDNSLPISSKFVKALDKVLKAVVGGTRVILRTAAELQLGLTGVNLRQTSITQHYKPVQSPRLITNRKQGTTVSVLSETNTKNNKKNKKNVNISFENRNVTIDQIFSNSISGSRIYWEFKAG